MLKYDWDPKTLYDILALRIITDTEENCYKILGVIHGSWKPVPGRLKDFIASPKPNGYKSIHTTLFYGKEIVEVQIRTEQMHREAEYGVAAHVAYAEAGKKKTGGVFTKNNKWLQKLLERQSNSAGADDLDLSDFFNDHIFVFTPKGEVVELPEGATPIDFAFAIHTDIGNHATGALVNDKFVPLDFVLNTGDRIEIKTKKSGKPSKKWLSYAKTSEARRNIKSSLGKSLKNI